MFWGFVALGSTIKGLVVTKTTAGVPTDATGAVAFRTYGPSSGTAMPNGTGSAVQKDPSSAGGTITGATNATPIVVTSAGHGLTVGTRVTISGVLGNTGANGTFVVSAVTSNTFTLTSSVGNGAYTSGGLWHVSGLYEVSITPAGADGYVQGITYAVLVTATVSGTVIAETHTFCVV